MRAPLMITAVAVVLGAAGFLLWKVKSGGVSDGVSAGAGRSAPPRSEHRDPGAGEDRAPSPRLDRPAPVREPDTPPIAADTGAGGKPRPSEDEIAAAHAMTIKLGDQVPQRIYDAAAPCYQGEPGKSQAMKIDYTLRVSDGVASLEDVVMTGSAWHAPRLEQCVLSALRAYTWPEPDLPNTVQKMDMEISLLGLIKRKRQAEPPGEEDDDE